MWTWLFTVASVTAVSLIALVGLAAVSLDEVRVRRIASFLVSFAVGALLGDAFIHLIPEAFARPQDTLRSSLLVLAGMLLFFVIEKLLRRRDAAETRPPLAAVNVIGDAIHNFLDGMLIGASYLVSPTLGASTTLAVVAHEVPQELGDFGILVHAGLPTRRALLVNLASASLAIAGAVVILLLGVVVGSTITAVLVPATAGGFVYIATADLVPELQRDRTLHGLLLQVGLIAAGIAVMSALTRLE